MQKAKTGVYYKSPFYFGFQTYKTLRSSCYSCKWAKGERSSDITLGDFWGIDKVDSTLDPDKGVSMLMPNTPKGTELLDRIISKGTISVKKFPFGIAQKNNKCLSHPTKCPTEARTRLFDKINNESFDEVVKSELTSRHRYLFNIYYVLPLFIQKGIRKLIDKIRY